MSEFYKSKLYARLTSIFWQFIASDPMRLCKVSASDSSFRSRWRHPKSELCGIIHFMFGVLLRIFNAIKLAFVVISFVRWRNIHNQEFHVTGVCLYLSLLHFTLYQLLLWLIDLHFNFYTTLTNINFYFEWSIYILHYIIDASKLLSSKLLATLIFCTNFTEEKSR